jgi:hypothetical protein
MTMRPLVRARSGRFRLRLSAGEREAILGFVRQLRSLLLAEDPSSDEAVARLFPAARPDDVIENLEWERTHAPWLLSDKLDALDVMERTITHDELTEDELLAWLSSLNSLRLVLGTRLDIREDSRAGDFAGDETAAGLFELYGYLTWLEDSIVEVLAGALDRPARGSGPPGNPEVR